MWSMVCFNLQTSMPQDTICGVINDDDTMLIVEYVICW